MLAGLYRFSTRGASGEKQGFQREELVEWAKRRFDAELDLDDLKNKQREEIRQVLVEHSRRQNEKANQVAAEAQQQVATLFASSSNATTTLGDVTGNNGQLDNLTKWLQKTCQVNVSSAELAKLDRADAERRVARSSKTISAPRCGGWSGSCSCRFSTRPGKSICLAMDHLRSSVNLRGYAQVDPKVEYKREGMRCSTACGSPSATT